jgi:hypothetical protein
MQIKVPTKVLRDEPTVPGTDTDDDGGVHRLQWQWLHLIHCQAWWPCRADAATG